MYPSIWVLRFHDVPRCSMSSCSSGLRLLHSRGQPPETSVSSACWLTELLGCFSKTYHARIWAPSKCFIFDVYLTYTYTICQYVGYARCIIEQVYELKLFPLRRDLQKIQWSRICLRTLLWLQSQHFWCHVLKCASRLIRGKTILQVHSLIDSVVWWLVFIRHKKRRL